MKQCPLGEKCTVNHDWQPVFFAGRVRLSTISHEHKQIMSDFEFETIEAAEDYIRRNKL